MNCSKCGQEIDDASLACASCGQLVHSAKLKSLYDLVANQREQGNFEVALDSLKEFQSLVPPDSGQYRRASQEISQLEEVISRQTEIDRLRDDSRKADSAAGSSLGRIGLSLFVLTLLFGWAGAIGMLVVLYLHEYGHILAIRYYGLQPGQAVLDPLHGAHVRLGRSPSQPGQWALISAAGPFATLLAAWAFLLAGELLRNSDLNSIGYYGTVLVIINMIPLGHLDGCGMTVGFRFHHWLLALVAISAMTHQRGEAVFYLLPVTMIMSWFLGLSRIPGTMQENDSAPEHWNPSPLSMTLIYSAIALGALLLLQVYKPL